MPLAMAKPGIKQSIKKITGKDTTKKFLESIGFVTGEDVTIISEMSGNIIVNVKDTRVAISKAMASRILI